LLDDGFQYWQLHRDVDIVLLDGTRPFDNGHCLPRGLLREPKRNLCRAHIVIISRSGDLTSGKKEELNKEINNLAPSANIYYSRHAATHCVASNAAAEKLKVPIKPLAVCAIARPDSFFETLQAAGVSAVGEIVFPDHFNYAAPDAARIIGKMHALHAESLVTTQKDFVKLGALLPDAPVFVQAIDFEIENALNLFSELFDRAMLPGKL
jgi:tetraacyldisaccharide 4'-kinase